MITKETNQITVLGKTFNSEEERRAYFREELRKHLPELKKMEGFPIGEDEDILNLSDPPYYTACPNPWLNNFIEQWENEKRELVRQGRRNEVFIVDEPYAADVSEGKNDPIYNAHSYHTKVPHKAIMRYILKYTQPGDIIFDGFAGTGMTGVAAQMCNDVNQISSLGYSIDDNDIIIDRITKETISKLGVRHALLNDLSPAATFISANYNTPNSAIKFKDEALKILTKIKSECGWLYQTLHSDEKTKGVINYTVWSDVFSCSNCSEDIVFWEAAVIPEEGRILDEFKCKNCNSKLTKRSLTRSFESIYDKALKKTIKMSKQVPVLINYSVGTKRFEKKPTLADLGRIIKIKEAKIKDWHPNSRMIEGRETRRNDPSGITHVHHFYTQRNLNVLAVLRRLIHESSMEKQLLCLLGDQLPRASKMHKIAVSRLNTNLSKTAGILAGTLYVPSNQIEYNLINMVGFRIKNVVSYLSKRDNITNQIVFTSSLEETGIKDNSIDYLFFDPPFGANINYSELNFLWESWLKVYTNNSNEAIENRAQGKSIIEYRRLMNLCFVEAFRILKPGKWMTVEFSNSKAVIWNSIQHSIVDSGFVIAMVAGLDKQQGSFKTVTTATAVKQDLVISCYKPSEEFNKKFSRNKFSNLGIWDFVSEHLDHLPIHLIKGNSTTAIVERSPKILFDRLIAFYIQKNLPVPIDAGKFQQGLRDTFIERDGMFFTNEQVGQYDNKKKENPDFIQLSILVSSEQDGVLWLKNLLKDKSFAYQDIQPLWMQALAGVRKGDVLPELAIILEENFLKDLNEKWYLPDPENEVDLEKLRNKRLLKQFGIYKEIAAKPKGKIKECRVDALRLGFKQCYQDKDFKTIVTVGDRIPDNLLMEDEVLLQFYDIASSRV